MLTIRNLSFINNSSHYKQILIPLNVFVETNISLNSIWLINKNDSIPFNLNEFLSKLFPLHLTKNLHINSLQ